MTGNRDGMRVAVLGGVPGALGGGGLEIQIARTAAALARRGLDVRNVHDAPADWRFDVLHVFGHTADVGHLLNHWRRQPAHLVVSPVVVVPPARERRLRLATRLPIPAFEPRVLRELAQRADRLIALTGWEASLLQSIGGGRTAPVAVIGNGVEREQPPLGRAELERRLETTLPDRYAIVVGSVSPRKRQAELARAVAGVAPLVVAGRWDGPPAERAGFAAAVEATGGVWLGEVVGRPAVDGLIAEAAALIHLSAAEGQSLAVLEALSLGTPCLLSDLPQQRELASEWPQAVAILEREADLAPALAALLRGERAATAVPTWDDVAERIVREYGDIAGPPRLWDERG